MGTKRHDYVYHPAKVFQAGRRGYQCLQIIRFQNATLTQRLILGDFKPLKTVDLFPNRTSAAKIVIFILQSNCSKSIRS